MKPADALAYRQAFIEAAERARFNSDDAKAIVQTVLGFARKCPVYFVASDMVTLAENAAASMPRTTVTENLLASSSGWMIYDRPFAALRPDKGSFELDGTPLVGIA